jgi:small-conductance mechanosensitive channel
MTRFVEEISLIERLYARYLGLGDVLRLTRPRFTAQLRRMLVERISVVWDGSRNAIEGWNREVTSHIDTQSIERRRSFQKRAESLSRIRGAADQLESRIGEIEQQDRQLRQQLEQLGAITRSLLRSAAGTVDVELPLADVDVRRAWA